MKLGLMGFELEGEKQSKKISLYLSPQCAACGLDKKAKHGKIPLNGEGRKKILICGESPGSEEDFQGKPFVGKTGQYLESTLAIYDIDMRRDCWIINAVRCRCWQWEENKKANRPPTLQEISYCRPYISGNGSTYGEIAKLKPDVVILLGSTAVTSVLGWLWKEDPGGINRWAGWQIPSQQINSYICPTYHPSYILREKENKKLTPEMLWKQHLKDAVSIKGKPWKEVPDYSSQVKVEMSPRQAAQYIRTIISMDKPTAFDYETNMLKPDSEEAEITCCSMSNGVITVAYPWEKEAITATQEFILSPLPKIASNCGFEERWTIKEFGHGVRNWWVDTMHASHILDNRPDITSIKWQAFALLGQPSWDDYIKPFFQSKGSNLPNKIKKADRRKLFHYCALDSRLEYEVAMIQAKRLGIKLE